MSRNIPFFEMFTELQLSPELRLKLAGAELTGAAIDQGGDGRYMQGAGGGAA